MFGQIVEASSGARLNNTRIAMSARIAVLLAAAAGLAAAQIAIPGRKVSAV